MQLHVWRNFRIELPDEWEMLQFSRGVESGRCAWADRYQFRLELDWRKVAGPLDFERMISDYRSKLRDGEHMSDVERTREAGWLGVRGRKGPVEQVRFGRHFGEESCLVEIVLMWPESRDTRLERTILRSVRAEPERLGGFRRWRAFGMDLLASPGLGLRDCNVEPANVRMTFADERSGWRGARKEETFRRMGMVSEWLARPDGKSPTRRSRYGDGAAGSARPDSSGSARTGPVSPVAEWLSRSAPGEVVARSQGLTEVRGHLVERMRGEWRAGILSALLGKRRRYEAAAWICPADGRLYFASVASALPEGPGEPGLAPGRLSCCTGLALAG